MATRVLLYLLRGLTLLALDEGRQTRNTTCAPVVNLLT